MRSLDESRESAWGGDAEMRARERYVLRGVLVCMYVCNATLDGMARICIDVCLPFKLQTKKAYILYYAITTLLVRATCDRLCAQCTMQKGRLCYVVECCESICFAMGDTHALRGRGSRINYD